MGIDNEKTFAGILLVAYGHDQLGFALSTQNQGLLKSSNRRIQELTDRTISEDYPRDKEQPEDFPFEYDYIVDYKRKRNDASNLELRKKLFSRFGRSTPKNFPSLIHLIYNV
eukprot:TRINITY_DN20851_c0_g1_i1.p1 TRINITY_DN20851_c0_g1~~TRINITY_DN20851_c0_g1_i1.p1  ORF type:complete len:129 (+),score=30.58 TRINITY_DN20851_c0_g1_i1:54-389(+)